MIMWVDNTITILARGEDRPIQGVMKDQRTYFYHVLRVSRQTRKSTTARHGNLLLAVPSPNRGRHTCGVFLEGWQPEAPPLGALMAGSGGPGVGSAKCVGQRPLAWQSAWAKGHFRQV